MQNWEKFKEKGLGTSGLRKFRVGQQFIEYHEYHSVWMENNRKFEKKM